MNEYNPKINLEITKDAQEEEIARLRVKFNRTYAKHDRRDESRFVTVSSGFIVNFFAEIKYYSEWSERLKKLLRERIKNHNFFDLGCGDEFSFKKTERFAADYGAGRYIGVDIKESDHYGSMERENGGPMDAYVLNGEMLEVVSSIPDGFGGNFFFSGIDEIRYNNKTMEYLNRLFEELHRVMQNGNIVVIGHQSLGLIKGNSFLVGKKEIVDENGKIIFTRVLAKGDDNDLNTVIYEKVL
jgi:hypothetical protein